MKKAGHIAMSLSSIEYYWREAFISMYRNRWLSLAAIGTVCISLVIFGMSILLVLNANLFMQNLESQLEIQVYLKNDMTEEQVSAMADVLKKIEGVSSVSFISKEEGLEDFKQKLGDNQAFVEGLDGENPLPDTYLVKAEDARNVPGLAKEMQKLDHVDTVTYGQGTVEKLLIIIKWIRVVGAGLIIILAIAAMLLITTTIRLSVFARRREINIMKYLGSTNWFVRCPFLLEGMLLGLVGAIVGAAIVYGGYISFAGNLNGVLPFEILLTDRVILRNIVFGLMGVGLFIGALAGGFSVKKYLRV